MQYFPSLEVSFASFMFRKGLCPSLTFVITFRKAKASRNASRDQEVRKQHYATGGKGYLGAMLRRFHQGASSLFEHAKQLSGRSSQTAYHAVGEKVPTSHDFDLDGEDGGEDEPKVLDASSDVTTNHKTGQRTTLHKRGKKTESANPFDDTDADPLADDDFDLLLSGTNKQEAFDPRSEGDAL